MEQTLQLSPTVEQTRKHLVEQTSVYAVEVVESILARHSDYAGKTPRPTLTLGGDAHQRPVDEWLAEVRSLFDSSLTPELHGKLVLTTRR